MRKIVLTLLLPVLVLVMAACGEVAETNTSTETPNQSPLTPVGVPAQKSGQEVEIMGELYTVPDDISDYDIIYDHDGIRISYLWFDPDGGFWGPEIMFYIENHSNIDYLVQTRYFHMNGIHIMPQLSFKYASGESGLMPLYFLHRNLNDTGICIIENVEFRFFFMEYSSPDNSFESDLIYLDLT